MTIIGLTGPTGAGKSELYRVAETYGFQVIDCDKTARKASLPGTKGLTALTEVFGKDILFPDGTLNRKTLAKKAFASPENTELLNRTLLPFIRLELEKEMTGEKVLLDAPTLFESGADTLCRCTVAVLADPDIRKQRIMARDNLTEEEAVLRMNAGKPDDFYRKKADYIIINNGQMADYFKAFAQIIESL